MINFCIAWLAMSALERFFGITSVVASAFPAKGPSNPKTEWASNVYASVFSPYTGNIDYVQQEVQIDTNIVERLRPFRQIHSFASATQIVLLCSFVIMALVLTLSNLMRDRRSGVLSQSSGIWILISSCFVALSFSARATSSGWDEAFVFASQARNFVDHWIPAVSITGKKQFAESSVDLLSILSAGSLGKLFTGLNIETCLIIGNLVLSLLLCIIIMWLMRKWYALSSISSSLILGAIILLPPHLMALSSGFPVMVADLGFALLILLTLRSFQTDDFRSLGACSVILGSIRWEYGPIAVFAICLGLICSKHRNWRSHFQPITLAIALQFGIGLIRWVLFGYPIPSGAIAKSVGIDSGYISSGLQYLQSTSQVSGWTGIAIFCLLVVLVSTPRSGAIKATVSICVLPLAIAPLAGGDWFPTEWSRYTMPTITSLILLGYISLKQYFTAQRVAGSLLTLSFYILFLFALNMNGLAAVIGGLYGDPNVGRLECLSRAGLTIDGVLPRDVGIATAEVNTLAFFAQQPLTDLSGLVDSRISTVDPSPLNVADLMHRKSNPHVIEEDRPGAIYLWEGARCPSLNPSSLNFQEEWQMLLNNEVSRFRAGPTAELLLRYSPVTLRNNLGDVIHILIRKDLVD